MSMPAGLGETQSVFEGTGHAVDPHQFLGLEINPRAAAIAELVLWIGYLQWHFRTFGAKMPAEPIIKPFHNIECRDAVLEYDRKEPVLDGELKPVTRWDGRTFKKHSVTGEGCSRTSPHERSSIATQIPRKRLLAEGGLCGGESAVSRELDDAYRTRRRLRRNVAEHIRGVARVG